jgi:hypothetical protein
MIHARLACAVCAYLLSGLLSGLCCRGFGARRGRAPTDNAGAAARADAGQPASRHAAFAGARGASSRARRASDLQACFQETGDYVTRGRTVFYVIAITNGCKARLRCEIFANVTGARGTSLGHTVMVLGRAGSGASKKSYDMRVKGAGGIAQVSRACKML